MLPASLDLIESRLRDEDVVLDVGGWAKPFARADWVVDVMPYETRGSYGSEGSGPERFSAATWIERDICARDPLPFGADEIDFAICSHTLEDIRDPIWVCSELDRVARAGYVEIPSRLEEQSVGINGPWAGWSHHRWLIDLVDGELQFVAKPSVLDGRPDVQLPASIGQTLAPAERVTTLFWEGELRARERLIFDPEELGRYLAAPVTRHPSTGGHRGRAPSGSVRRVLGRALRRLR